MSIAADQVRKDIKEYLDVMHAMNKKPSFVHVKKKQFYILKKEYKDRQKALGIKTKETFKPRFMGYELIMIKE